MVELKENEVEINDVDETEEVMEAEVVGKETVKDKLKNFGRKHKKPLLLVGGAVAFVGAITLKVLFFSEELGIDDDAVDVDVDDTSAE